MSCPQLLPSSPKTLNFKSYSLSFFFIGDQKLKIFNLLSFCCVLRKGNRIKFRHQLNGREWCKSIVHRYLRGNLCMERIRKIRSEQNLVGVREASVEKGAWFTQKRKLQGLLQKTLLGSSSQGSLIKTMQIREPQPFLKHHGSGRYSQAGMEKGWETEVLFYGLRKKLRRFT